MISNWSVLKDYINSKPINCEIKRKLFKDEVPKGLTKASFDVYCKYLTTLYVLENTEPGTYKVLQYIPKKMNTSILFMMLSIEKSWERWFIPIEERVSNITYKLIQKRVSEISDIK